MGTKWLVTIWRWKIYVFSNWWLVSAAAGGLQDIPGHWGHLIWSGDGIVCGWPLVRAGHEEIIYPRFIVKLLTALERLGPHLATWTGHGTSRVKCDFWAGIFLILQSRSHVPPVCPENHCVPRVTWGQATKTHSGEPSRCSVTGTQPFKRAARGLRGLSTEHLPQFKLELGHEKFKMDPCNF